MIRLIVKSAVAVDVPVPVATGVPFPQGILVDASRLRLDSPVGAVVPLQAQATEYHADGSVKWVLLDFLVERTTPDGEVYSLRWSEKEDRSSARPAPPLVVESKAGFFAITYDGHRVPVRFRLTIGGRPIDLPVDLRSVSEGPVRSTWEIRSLDGVKGVEELRLSTRVSAWPDAGLVRLDVCLLNPRRARHRGGLWDLGDNGAVLFNGFELVFGFGAAPRTSWRFGQDAAQVVVARQGRLHQDSSGGENWNFRTHVNRDGRIPCRFRGWRFEAEECQLHGERAQPVVVFDGLGDRSMALTVSEFWQNFPKTLEVDPEGAVRVGLFPEAWDDFHELQGGERKTHSVWLDFSAAAGTLGFVHAPPWVVLPPEWWEECRVFEAFAADTSEHAAFAELRDAALGAGCGLAAKKEIVDEFGWRNWGDLWADHEQLHYAGPKPIVSHYNNQYDVIEGLIRNFARTGDARWRDLFDPLARHVLDIDLYHTDRDRPVYNGGLFWHTDHYKDAATSTHRTYSRANTSSGADYGGGPSSSHCYTTGLLHYWYLTGNPDARDAVIDLAEWLIAMEDGEQTIFGAFHDGPTGTSSASGFDGYHGPGRGPGNTVNTLVDAWELTGDHRYIKHAEAILRRVIRPIDDFASLRLDDAENRWFYVVFLHAVCRYLDAKLAAGENDAMYAYSVACVRHYGEWMAEHEHPWLDRPERLEFPTETWAAQEVRKANAMRRMARFCPTSLRRQLLGRAKELADRGWSDLSRFESRFTLRPTVICLVEGLKDAFYRSREEPPAPEPLVEPPPPEPAFVPQRDKVADLLRSPRGAAAAAFRLAAPRRWVEFVGAVRKLL